MFRGGGSRIGYGDSEPQDYQRSHLFHVFALNLALTAACVLLSIPMFIWFVRSVYYLDNSLDRTALMMFPVFYYLCLILPLVSIWMWVNFFRLSRKERRFIPFFLLSVIEFSYGAGGVWMTALILQGMG